MSAKILPFPSRRLPIDCEIGEVVEVVRLRDALDEQGDHECWAGDHVAVFPAQPRHAGRAKMSPGIGISEALLALPDFEFGGGPLHGERGNIIRYKLTMGCNTIRSFEMSAIVLPFIRMEDQPNRILELRRAAGLSQEELGLRIGVSKMHISGLERGKRELSLGLMRRLADALGVLAADLLSAEDNPLRLDDEERTLLLRYRSVDRERRKDLARVAEALAPFRHQERDVA